MTIRSTTLLTMGLVLLIWSGPVSAQGIDKLVVLPIQDRTEESSGDLETMKKFVTEYFGNSKQVEILSEDQLQSLLDAETGTRRSLAQTVAEKTGCNGVLIFTLDRYRQRVGGDLSVTDPASLAFNFRLFKAPEGQLVCSGRFDETQQPLSENILDFAQARKRGFK